MLRIPFRIRLVVARDQSFACSGTIRFLTFIPEPPSAPACSDFREQKTFWMIEQDLATAFGQGTLSLPLAHQTTGRECGYVCRIGKFLVRDIQFNPSHNFMSEAECQVHEHLGQSLSSRVTGQRYVSCAIPDEV